MRMNLLNILDFLTFQSHQILMNPQVVFSYNVQIILVNQSIIRN